jgi:hypothetical protein
MSIRSRHQLENTRKKLQLLEERCRVLESAPEVNTVARDLNLRSLKKLINQMKEEMARFEARVAVRSEGD